MDRTRSALAGAVVGLLAVVALEAPAQAVAPATWFTDPALSRSFEDSLRGAVRMLADPRCLDVLSDFTVPEGGTLKERLERTGQSAPDYLQSLAFVGEEMGAGCRAGYLAHTRRGSPRIVLCRRFVSLSRESPPAASQVLIHEMLHSLGLGEDPPSSREINWAVAHRCGA